MMTIGGDVLLVIRTHQEGVRVCVCEREGDETDKETERK